MARPFWIVLSLAELGLGTALLPASTARWAATGAAALLVLFSLVIVIQLGKGRRPHCPCFGQSQVAPISSKTLLRNGCLILLAVFVAAQMPPPLFGIRLAALPPSAVLAGIALVFGLLLLQSWFLFELLKQNGRLLLRLEALEDRLDKSSSAARPPVWNVPAENLPGHIRSRV